MSWAPTSPLANVRGYVGEHRLILFGAIGPGTHPCHWCQTPVTWVTGQRGTKPDTLVVDHVDGNEFNNAATNLVPACQRCNTWRQRQQELIPEGEPTVPNGQWRVRAEERTCGTCGEKFLFSPAKHTKPGRGRYCSLPCLWDRNKKVP